MKILICADMFPAMTRLTSEIIQSVPNLKLVQQFGVGLEGVDLGAAAARGIPVANVPGAFSTARFSSA